MINVTKLKDEIRHSGLTQKTLAKKIGISERTLYNLFERKTTRTSVAEKIIKELNLKEPMSIFFTDIGTN